MPTQSPNLRAALRSALVHATHDLPFALFFTLLAWFAGVWIARAMPVPDLPQGLAWGYLHWVIATVVFFTYLLNLVSALRLWALSRLRRQR